MKPDQEQYNSWLSRLRESFRARRQRPPPPPLVLRYCPKSVRRFVDPLFFCLGYSAFVVFVLSGFVGFLTGPVIYARSNASSPLADWIRKYLAWLAAHCSKDNFDFVYLIAQLAIMTVLMYLANVCIWLLKYQRPTRNNSNAPPAPP